MRLPFRLIPRFKPVSSRVIFVGWDQWRFAAPAHHHFSMFLHGEPALEASLSHPTLKQGAAEPPHPASFAPPRFLDIVLVTLQMSQPSVGRSCRAVNAAEGADLKSPLRW